MKRSNLTKLAIATGLLLLMAGNAAAEAIDYGKFDGYTLRAKLIGGV